MTKVPQQKNYRYILAFIVIMHILLQYRKFYSLFYRWSEWRQDYSVNLTSFGEFLLSVSAVSHVRINARLELELMRSYT